MTHRRKILSIDGGGIRGIIPALVLDAIEKCTKKPIAELFDLIAGTSTGGILALGLTKPNDDGVRYSARDLADLYVEEGEAIFHRGAWHRLTALGNILEEKYPATGVEDVLQRYFEDTRLSDATTDILVTSYEIERRKPYFFKSHKAREEPDRDHLMWEAARATSAAPTYFEPAKIAKVGSKDYLSLIDGGVFANNPAMCGYVEAQDIYPEEQSFFVVSIGTGELTRKIPFDEAKGWGLALWAQPLLGTVFDGVSDTVSYQLEVLCREEAAVQRYYRFQPELVDANDDMDDASRTNIRALALLAEKLIEREAEDLQRVCDALVA